MLETDSSDHVSAGVLSQPGDDGEMRPVAFFLKKLMETECNYEIYDKELLAIVRCFEEWRPELEGAAFPIKVITDHRNLEYFMETRTLNRRQARWSEFLSRFQFHIVYRLGKLGGKPDALTRRSQDLPKPGDPRLTHQSQVVIKTENLPDFPHQRAQEIILAPIPANDDEEAQQRTEVAKEDFEIDHDSTVDSLINKAYGTDGGTRDILTNLRAGERLHPALTFAQCSEHDVWLYVDDRLWIPNDAGLRARLMYDHHNAPIAGHPGRSKTYGLLSRRYFWPRMVRDISRWTRNCNICRKSKTTNDRLNGLLCPLPVPERPWNDISVDFVTGLERSRRYDAIMVVVDRLTKMRHFIPCRANCSAKATAHLFVENV